MLIKVWRSGKGQSIRLPKGFRFKGREVEIFRRGEEVVLREKEKTMRRALELIAALPHDFDVPGDGPPRERKGL
jgi:antitoxin VapB